MLSITEIILFDCPMPTIKRLLIATLLFSQFLFASLFVAIPTYATGTTSAVDTSSTDM